MKPVKAIYEQLRSIYRVVIGIVLYIIENQLTKFQWYNKRERPIVQIGQGQLRGITTTLPNGSTYHYFKGIPYAKPPVGELRFKPPVPIEKFDSSVLDCAVDRNEFIQPNLFLNSFITGSERALYLNVYTPQLPATNDDETSSDPQLPVMIYIHGGGYMNGSCWTLMYDPKHLVQEGVVVVSINYRLGPLGFLSLPSMGIAGNAGLKDQLMAFKWVKENIKHFGGNADNVTLFGASAGSWSTYLHYLSDNSRKYFNRAICQSGVVCTESFFQVDPAGKAHKLANILGYKGDSDEGVYDTLMKAPAHLLVRYQHRVANNEERKLAMSYQFRPVIEQTESEDSIITKTPEEILKNFNSIQTPLITGCNSGEGMLSLYFMNMKNQFNAFDRELDRLVPCFLKENPAVDCVDIGSNIKRFYFGEQSLSKRTKQQLCDLLSDNTFVTTSLVNAELLAKYQPNVTHYHYRFTYHGRFSIFKGIFGQGDIEGASHGDEVFYIFDSTLLPQLSRESDESKVRRNFVKLWTNFAKYGQPTPTENSSVDKLSTVWLPVQRFDPTSQEFELTSLYINTNLSVEQNPYKERMDFWRKMFNEHKSNFLCSKIKSK